MIIPIRTESAVHRTPRVNIALIVVNVLAFLATYRPGTHAAASPVDNPLAFQADGPAIYQFFTYQFLHADIGHLLGNMLFLWVFGNSVNGKLGDIPYLLFYLASGAFAAWGYATLHPSYFQLIGASGAIAAVTTAYLALFPRSHVTVLVWFFVFLQFFEVPAMLLIGLKIIFWDNIVAPSFGSGSNVAYGAHLAGYLFGFVAGLLMLLFRGVARDQFDILALWHRWYRRREYAAAMAGLGRRGPYGALINPSAINPMELAEQTERIDRLSELRTRIGEALGSGSRESALELYAQLLATDSSQCLSEREQLLIAREYFAAGLFLQSAAAYARFLDVYPHSLEAANIRLLLGIILARNLHNYEDADRHLSESFAKLQDTGRRDQCLAWLRQVRSALGRPLPEV